MAIRLMFSKKAIFFSILSIFILLAFLILFSSLFEPQTFLQQQDVEDELVILSNNQLSFFKDVYLHNAIRTSTRLAIISFIDEINENDGFLIDCQDVSSCDDDTAELNQLKAQLINFIAVGNKDGTYAGQSTVYEGRFALPEYKNLTLTNQLNEIRKIYRDHFQVDLNIIAKTTGKAWPVDPDTDFFDDAIVDGTFVDNNVISELSIGQVRPFMIQVNFSLGFNYSTKSDTIRWLFPEYNVSVDVPIYGLIDPVYMVHSEDIFGFQYNNTLRENSYYRKQDNILMLYNTSDYIASPDIGPSFLQKLVNSDRSSSCCGIESIVNLYDVYGRPPGGVPLADIRNIAGPPWYQRSSVDYLFFYDRGYFVCGNSYENRNYQLYYLQEIEDYIPGSSFFTLDKPHADRYDIPVNYFKSDPASESIDEEDFCYESPGCLSDSSCVAATSE